MTNNDDDEKLARALQEEFYAELLNTDDNDIHEEVSSFLPKDCSPKKMGNKENLSVVSPEWEDLDPTPDLHALFLQFNEEFFWSRLSGCEVKWSPRMTLCAGVCSYQRRAGYCSIRLSVPLLKLRPRKDLVETLLHEMIHAYLFVTDGNDDHDGHGPAFHEHMFRINKRTGAKISVYHNFHDEVDNYRTHWWQCDGPCRQRKPFYGIVKRAMNRAPGPNDRWWNDHENSCGGTYTKIKEPENYGRKKKSTTAAAGEKRKKEEPIKGQPDIRSFVKNPKVEGKKVGKGAAGGGSKGNIFGFGGTSFHSPAASSSGMQSKSKATGAFVVKPGWNVKDNSSSGHVINSKKSEATEKDKTGGADIREQLRKAWGEKFQNKSDKKEIQCDIAQVDCPVCDKKVDASAINSHLDRCISNEDTPQAQTDAISIVGETLPCPVCQKQVYKEEMNTHLDFCSSSK